MGLARDLQNIITNDINAVSENNSCFAGLLSPQGKYLYDFIVVKHKSGYFLDCEKKIIDELYKQLKLYKLRSKVDILNLSNEFVVAALHKDKFLELENSKDQNGYTIKYREDTILLDPRHTELGARLIINLEKLYLSLKKLNLQSSNVDEYYNLSHSLGVPQTDTKELQNLVEKGCPSRLQDLILFFRIRLTVIGFRCYSKWKSFPDQAKS